MSTTTKEQQNPNNNSNNPHKDLITSYINLSFTIFLSFLPKNSIQILQTLQLKNKTLTSKLTQAEQQIAHLLTRRKEDSKANARVVEIFASHRHAWQQEEKRLLQQIDDCNEELGYLKGRFEEFEGLEAELKGEVEDLKRGVCERDEMLSFAMMNSGGEMGGFGDDLVSFGGSKMWAEKGSLWQNTQYESLESAYNAKHFVARRESPWKVNNDSTGVASKLKLLEQELVNLERIGKEDLSKVASQMRKQAKRYQGLSGQIDDLCRRMQVSDPSDPTLSSEFRTQRQTEFLLEAFRLQQRASETNQKLTALQTETGKSSHHGKELDGQQAQLATKRSLDSIRNNFKEIQRNLEIWLARIIGDLEGILARDGASHLRILLLRGPGTAIGDIVIVHGPAWDHVRISMSLAKEVWQWVQKLTNCLGPPENFPEDKGYKYYQPVFEHKIRKFGNNMKRAYDIIVDVVCSEDG